MFRKVQKTIFFAGMPLAFICAASAQDYAGKQRLTVVAQEARPLDATGRVVLATLYKGTNVSTGGISYMDGAQVLLVDMSDAVKGNGPEQGVLTFIKDGVSKTSGYVGAVKTVQVDGKPVTTTESFATPLSVPVDIWSTCVFSSQTQLDCEWWSGLATRNAAEYNGHD
jgi:hypothetical protein